MPVFSSNHLDCYGRLVGPHHKTLKADDKSYLSKWRVFIKSIQGLKQNNSCLGGLIVCILRERESEREREREERRGGHRRA